jgi:Glyoxalase-like domain
MEDRWLGHRAREAAIRNRATGFFLNPLKERSKPALPMKGGMGLPSYPVDHLVLPTISIASARERLAKLGFTVAADAVHPFGTENACVFLSDQTYLEPLGVTDRDQCVATGREGNVFTARDQAYRFRLGEEGFSAIVFGTPDARVDDRRFRAAGLSAGKLLEFSRPVRMPDDSQSVAGFRLAFAADLRAPDFLAFCCERTNPLPADRATLERHANSAVGIEEVALSAPEPSAFAGFLASVANDAATVQHSFGLTVTAANARLSIMTPRGMQAFYNLAIPDTDRGLRARAILFRVRDLSVTAAHLAANGVTYTRMGSRILIPAALGQGALFAFEEIP